MTRYADVTFRPIDSWPGAFTRSRRRASFSASWTSTLDLLERELRALSARHVVLQVAMDESDIRLDGRPRANARAEHPGIILAFDSRHGPIKFAVDAFDRWEDNLRAIALAMEALRKVDRYGVTRRGEQYTGWRAIPASTDAAEAVVTPEQARAVLEEFGDGDPRAALFATHPDRGGKPDDFRRVQRAREVLGIA